MGTANRDRRGSENGSTKPTLTVRPDWLENREGSEHGRKSPKTLGIGGRPARVRGCSLVWGPQTDRRRAKRDRKRTAAVRERMSDNHGYGRES